MQKIRVYTTTICPYCISTKRLLKQLKLEFEEISLENDPGLRAKLAAENGGWRTVPMIFVGSEFIGGYDDLNGLHKRGELLPKVQRA